CLRRTLSQYLVDRIHSAPNIEVMRKTEVIALHGDHMLGAVTVRNNQTRKKKTFAPRWLFWCLGGEPQTNWARDIGICRDSDGYLVTGPDLAQGGQYPNNWPLERSPFYLETSTPNGCEECLKMGDTWVHLRLCLECGHVGCCDSSKNKHATKHFHHTKHPIIRSLEPGEDWGWCYVDELELDFA